MIFKRVKMIFKLLSNKQLILLFFLISSNLNAQTFEIQLQAEAWDVSRHGELLIKMPELSTMINKWSENTAQKIELRYPGGEEGVFWVEEFIGRLVSLGVPSSAIHPLPSSGAEDIIHVVLIEAVKK